jgi:hypothetical protein
MVYGQVVEGSPKELAEKIAAIVGDRRVKVYIMEEAKTVASQPRTEEEIKAALAELDALAVSVPHVDDSREGIYMRSDDE